MTLFDGFKELMPSPTEVIDRAIREKLTHPNKAPKYIKRNFSKLVEEIQVDAYNIYLQAEKSVGKRTFKKVLTERCRRGATRDEVIEVVCKMFPEFDRLYLSLTQSRRTRAGSAFEIILKTMFKQLKYPFDEQQVINGKPDFLMPSRKHYDKNPMDCIIFTAKRSLRERWRQVVTEGTRGLGFYLATIDEAVSSVQLAEMLNHRIYLVVPANIKKNVKAYENIQNVITFEEFFRHHLDPAAARWRDKGII